MLIDIDIKIADNDGNLVHHFEKRFDDDTACPEKLNNNYFGESFEDFLSEYMSFSGYAVREKLITGNTAATGLLTFLPTVGGSLIKRGAISNLDNRSLDYQIRIGRKNVFIGRIPLANTSPAEKSNDVAKNTEMESQIISSLDQELASLDHMIDYAMLKAIAKYEANLCPISKEEEYECMRARISESNS